ncbi:MAG: MerR family DNA-binding protein [Actinomycetia bacterium]|nr:MerR family DNA-binding protein [Actinomycetes bacterium]
MTSTELLPIGSVAASTGASVSTVRYYEEIGMISVASRVGGKRRFHPETVGRVSFIRRAKEVGFSLGEIRSILDDEAGGWLGVVEDKIDELDRRRGRLELMIAMLKEMRDCGCEAVASCPRSDDFALEPESSSSVATP